MFKKIKKKITSIYNDHDRVKIKLSEVKFTLFKKQHPKYGRKDISWTEEQEELFKDITEGKYEPKDNLPSLSKDDVCVNGHHRLTSLLEVYGPNYEVEVYKLKKNYKKIFLLTIFYIIFFKKDK